MTDSDDRGARRRQLSLARLHRDVILDDREGLQADALALTPGAALAALDEVLAARDALEANAQPRLTLEACFMTLAAVGLTAR